MLVPRAKIKRLDGRLGNVLIGIGHLVLNGALIVDASAVRAPALFAMGLDVVVAELTDLEI
jgi:carbonic anhydrase/acetyltransferase-like protein (isoleucine patch superfamily)